LVHNHDQSHQCRLSQYDVRVRCQPIRGETTAGTTLVTTDVNNVKNTFGTLESFR